MPAFDQLSLGANGNTGGGAARHIGFSVAALMLAGTALAPAFAQTADLGGLTVSRNDFVNFNPPGIGIEPTEITNGLLRINPLASLTFAGDLTDSGGTFSLLKFGANDLTLASVNTRSGQTTVQGGRLIAGSATALSANSLLAIAGPVAGLATADLNGFNQTVNGLVGNIRSVSIDKDALLLQAGLGANLSDKIRIGVDYSGLIGARNDDHGGRATLNFAF